MKRCVLLMMLSGWIIAVLAQTEGIVYRSVNWVTEKHYIARQRFGDDKLKLDRISIGFYDTLGQFTLKLNYKGNQTYDGRSVFARNAEDAIWEVKTFSSTDNMIARFALISDSDGGGVTELTYDSKGRISSKLTTRKDPTSGTLWQKRYNEIGYNSSYFRIIENEQHDVISETKFDYFDEVEQICSNLYNTEGKIVRSTLVDEADTLLSTIEYKYDERGNLVERFETDRDGFPTVRKTYFYDEAGRLIQSNLFEWTKRFGGIPLLREQNDYTYDIMEYPDLMRRIQLEN